MLTRQAKRIAEIWVSSQGSKVPGYLGAYFTGSVNWLDSHEEFPQHSDIDIRLVFDKQPSVLGKQEFGKEAPGKILREGLIVEVAFDVFSDLGTVEDILANYHFAPAFSRPCIVDDPTGRLGQIQLAVEKRYAEPEWLDKRILHAFVNLARFRNSKMDDLHEQVTGWLFAWGACCHVLLVAALRNPTIRKRYVATKQLLVEVGEDVFYRQLLHHSCLQNADNKIARSHLDLLIEIYDLASRIQKTPYRFADNINASSRVIAIDGSLELIETNFSCEAEYWILATYCRCLAILKLDASTKVFEHYQQELEAMLVDLGLKSSCDLTRNLKQLDDVLSQLRRVANRVSEFVYSDKQHVK